MKFLAISILACMNYFFSMAQERISVTTTQTTCLIFPAAVKYVDRGSQDVISMQVKEAGNILFLKAAKPGFALTNVSVVTNDGRLYSLPVRYDSLPEKLVYHPGNGHYAFHADYVAPKDLEAYSKIVLEDNKPLRLASARKWGVRVAINGVYATENTLFFRIDIDNRSPISYDIEATRFYIRDSKRGKRTAIQEREVTPIHLSGSLSAINADDSRSIVVAIEKFTLPDAKYFAIELVEANGGRHVGIKIRNGHIMKAKQL